MIWTHLKGMVTTCAPHNRNLEMPYYGRALGGCAYTVEGEDPDIDSLFAIFPDGHAEFRSRENAVPDLDYKYPDCAGGVQLDMDCVTWADAGASWDCCPGTCDCTNGELEVLGVGPRQILDNDEGEILDESGNPIEGIIVSECGEVPPVTFTCGGCLQNAAPAQMQVVVAGFENQGVNGQHCIDMNATWVIDYTDPFTERTCRWINEYQSEPPSTFPGFVEVIISYDEFIPRDVRYRGRVVAPSESSVNTQNDFALHVADQDNPADCLNIVDLELPEVDAPGCGGSNKSFVLSTVQ